MAKRTTKTQNAIPDFVTDPEFKRRLRKSVRDNLAKCSDQGTKTSKWFRTFAGCCNVLADSLTKSSIGSSVVENLRSTRRLVANVSAAKSSNLYGPLIATLDALVEQPELFSPAVGQVFDQIRELVYPGKTETQRGGSATQDTVQEFDKAPPLQEDELAEIEQTLEWSRSLDPEQLHALLGLSTQQLLRYLTTSGFSIRELARQLDVTHNGLGYIMRGKRDPSGAIQKKVLMFAVFHMFDD